MNVIGAQRLAASRTISVGPGLGSGATVACVLNALRHHGLFRTLLYGTSEIGSEECSTPCGITDYFG